MPSGETKDPVDVPEKTALKTSIFDLPLDAWWKRPFDKATDPPGCQGEMAARSAQAVPLEKFSLPPIVSEKDRKVLQSKKDTLAWDNIMVERGRRRLGRPTVTITANMQLSDFSGYRAAKRIAEHL